MTNSDNTDYISSELSFSQFNGKRNEVYELLRMRRKAACRFNRVCDGLEGKSSPSTTSSQTTTT